MATSRPFALNVTLNDIYGCTQVGNLAISNDQYVNDLPPVGESWWMGPNEDIGYVIAHAVDSLTQITPMRITWDPNKIGQYIGLGNNNRSADAQINSSLNSMALATKTDTVSSRLMFSVVIYLNVSNGRLGFANGSCDLNRSVGDDPLLQSVGFTTGGSLLQGGAAAPTTGPQPGSWGAPGDIVDVAVDVGASALWLRVNGGDWNNDPGADPGSGTGGINPSALVPTWPLYPAVSPGDGKVTILETSTYSVPGGFTFLGSEYGSVGFNRTAGLDSFSDNKFINLAKFTIAKFAPGLGPTITTAKSAQTELTANGLWSSFDIINAGLLVKLKAEDPYSYSGSGPVWYDVSGQANNGTISGATHGGDHFSFNGSSNFIALNTPIPTGDSYSISAWVNQSANNAGAQNIVSSQDSPLWVSNGTLYAGVGGSYTIVQSPAFPVNTWKLVTVTYDSGSGSMKLYINGAQVDSGTTVGSAYVAQPTFIGSHYVGFNVSFWEGRIAQVYIHNNVQSAQYILNLYNATKAIYGL